MRWTACWVLLAGALVAEARAAEPFLPPQELGALHKVERSGDAVVFHAQRGSVRVNFVSDAIVRIFMDPYRRFADRPSVHAVMDGSKYQAMIPVRVEETATAVQMTGRRLRVTVEKGTPVRFIFETAEGQPLTGIVKPMLTGSMESDYHRVRLQIAADEQFYGLGERFFSFNHRGSEIVLRNVDVINQPKDFNYFSIPFFMSSRGYGIFYNNTWETKFRFGSDIPDELSLESPGPNCDLFFIHGPQPRQILANYLQLTGYPPLVPRYALGLWMGDFPHEDQDRVIRVGQEFINHQLPWDNFYLDYEWANTYFDFKFHPQTTPHPEDLGAWFRHHHRQLALIETPFTNAECPLYEEALSRKFFVDPLSAWWHTESASGQIDFSNPEAAAWWWKLHEASMQMGVSFFVTDDGEFTREKALASDGVGGAELHNYYSLLYARGMFEGMEKSSNSRGFICSRAGFAGSQKFGSFFAGDQNTDYANLLKVTRAVLSSGLSGMPFLRTDLAGLLGELDPARYMRFIQSQALHPMLMLFTYIPTTAANKYAGKLDRRPWTYGEPCLENFRKHLQLRHSLVPYLYTLAAEAHEAGAPIVRPLLFEYPQDLASWGVEDQYLVGPDLLVAPVMTQDRFAREVYLPAGSEWVDFWSDRIYSGGQKINYQAPIDVLPMLARRGAILPFQDPLLTLSNNPYPDLTWRIYPSSQDERFVLYEDDGLTQDYKQGKAARTQVNCTGGRGIRINVRADGPLSAGLESRKHTFEVHLLAAKPQRVSVTGKRISVRISLPGPVPPTKPWASWNETGKILTIYLPSLPGNEGAIEID